MNLLPYLRSLAAKFLHRSRTENDLEEELRSHIRHRVDDLERSGLDREEAERRARIEFGSRSCSTRRSVAALRMRLTGRAPTPRI